MCLLSVIITPKLRKLESAPCGLRASPAPGFVVWVRLGPVVWVWGARRRSRCVVKGVFFRLARLCARCFGVLYLGTLSERDVGSLSTLHGFAYCKSSRERRVGSPTGQYLGCACVLSLVFVPVRLRVSSRTGLSQQSPALWLRLAPSATPWCFPISDARRVYLVDSFIAGYPQLNAHTNHPSRTSYGHTFSG